MQAVASAGRRPVEDALCALSRSAAAKVGARRGCRRRKVKLTGGARLSTTQGGGRATRVEVKGSARTRPGEAGWLGLAGVFARRRAQPVRDGRFWAGQGGIVGRAGRARWVSAWFS